MNVMSCILQDLSVFTVFSHFPCDIRATLPYASTTTTVLSG